MKVIWTLLSFALVGTIQPVFAEEQRTVTICNNNIPSGCAINGSFPPPKYATCRGRSGSPDEYHTTVCRAKPGYIFWVGKCNYGRGYVATGRIGTQMGGGTEWCLRRDGDAGNFATPAKPISTPQPKPIKKLYWGVCKGVLKKDDPIGGKKGSYLDYTMLAGDNDQCLGGIRKTYLCDSNHLDGNLNLVPCTGKEPHYEMYRDQ